MDDRVDEMVRRLLGRKASSDDRARIAKLLADLPPEMLASPAALADIVLRAEHLRQLEEAIEKASWQAQQRIHHDLPHRIEQAALMALNKLRDQLPIDAPDRVARLLRWTVAWTAVVALVAGIGGWMLHEHAAKRQRLQGRAESEQAFNRCMEATEGVAMSARPGVAGLRYDAVVYRIHARACATEYADRYSGG